MSEPTSPSSPRFGGGSTQRLTESPEKSLPTMKGITKRHSSNGMGAGTGTMSGFSSAAGGMQHLITDTGMKKSWGDNYNSFGYQIPIINLFYHFLDGGSEPPSWPQIEKLMQNLAIVAALVLTLVITFHSSVTYDELAMNDARFQQYGADGELLGWRAVGDIMINNGYATWWYGQKAKTVTLTQFYNFNFTVGTCFLTICLLLAVMVLVGATTTPIARPSAHVTGHQYRLVMSSFMNGWHGIGVFLIVLVVIFTAVLGVVFFFEGLKLQTYLKFPDQWVERMHSSQTFAFANSDTVYGFIDAVLVWLVYFMLFIFLIVTSIGQRAAYCYPMKPVTVLGTHLKDEVVRGSARARLTKFLALACHIPTAENETLDDFIEGKETFIRSFVFLTGVGGGCVNEAEVIAESLLDAGIMTIEDFRTFVEEGDGALYELPGISIGAATQIIWEFRFGRARHDIACYRIFESAQDESDEVVRKKILTELKKSHIPSNDEWIESIFQEHIQSKSRIL